MLLNLKLNYCFLKKKTKNELLKQICPEFKQSKCEKSADECAMAHPPAQCPVDAENGLVTVCVDFIKGKCNRETCKYFHPPEHLVTQLKKQKINNNAAVAAAHALAASVTSSLPAKSPTSTTVLPLLSKLSNLSGSNYRQHSKTNSALYQTNSYNPYGRQITFPFIATNPHHQSYSNQFGN
jgi:hypothetical protein